MKSNFSSQIEKICDAFCEAMDFDRAQLATALGVKEESIQEWISDKKFPDPRTFRALYTLINHHSGMSRARSLMSNLLVQPLETITPLHTEIEGFRKKGDCRHLNDYLVLPVFDGVLPQLLYLDREKLETLLVQIVKQIKTIN